MNISIVGCGYVADFYARSLPSHANLKAVGAYDRDHARRDAFCRHFNIKPFESLEAALTGSAVETVVNLTNPRSHFAVSAAAIRAGRHIYSEKPLGMTSEEARALLALAAEHGVRLGCAPCNALNETNATLAKHIAAGTIGRVRMVYANYDDGMIAPNEKPWNWKSESGARWPAKDEFEIGCTYEHAGYFMTILVGLLGPARAVTAFASTQVADKGIPVDGMAPDFSVGCVEFDDGVVARVTCGLVAPSDKSLTIVGTKGVLLVRFLRNDREAVLIGHEEGIRPTLARAKDFARKAGRRLKLPVGDFGLYRVLEKPSGPPFVHAGPDKPVDFLRGLDDLENGIRTGKPHRLSGEVGLHLVEIIEALQYPERYGYRRSLAADGVQPFLRAA